MPAIVPFSSLGTSDLMVDAIYKGGHSNNVSDDPLSRLIPGIGNQGGFRQAGKRDAVKLVVLYTSMDDPDWPDSLDVYSGAFTYFGDNKQPGYKLHETRGNHLLRSCFDRKDTVEGRAAIPPFFIFSRGARGRDVVFRGLAVPGIRGDAVGDLVALWRSRKKQRFQNYRALFTILDVAFIPRAWLSELTLGSSISKHAPTPWRTWVKAGVYQPLTSTPTVEYRTKEEQLPSSKRDEALVRGIYEYFKDSPHEFEHCAARIASMMDPNITVDEVTRRSVDGGRDAIGTYRLGPIDDQIELDFALEAKCYELGNGVGVGDLSRLISRLRHRQFGILVTTSYLNRQAYKEVREDRHPVIIIAAADIAAILLKADLGTTPALSHWLASSFPREAKQAATDVS